MLRQIAAAGLLAALAVPVQAGEAGDITRAHLYSGDLAGGRTALAPLLGQADREAEFGVGLIDFVGGIEQVAQALYRHGLAAPDTGMMGPRLTVPVESNPDPEPLDYEGVRGILEAFVATMESASATLHEAGQGGDWVVKLDPLQFRIDADDDGKADATETVAAVMSRIFGMTPSEASMPRRQDEGDRSGRSTESSEEAMPTAIGFDRADAIWLAGYSQVLLAQADFLLAHDFSTLVNVSFHRIFPRAGFPMQDFARGGMLMFEPGTDTAIADAVAAIHAINWPVIDAARLQRVRERAKTVLRYSRENWQAILAETDDDAELVPSPRQSSIVPEGTVTDEVVAAWMATLDTAEKVLDGDLLLPHWRFRQGFDLSAYFEAATRTDLVLLLTGYDAVPFLRDGPIADARSFAEGNRVFGDNFFNYIFWFN